MVEPAVSDADPLGAFSYISNYHYGQFPNSINPTYQLAVKPEEFYTVPQSSTSNNTNYNIPTTTPQIINKQDTSAKLDIKPLLKSNGKVKKEKRSFVSQKITEEGYPFYGCAVCNISFPTLQELDSHVATHKGRTTSYDLRVKNALKKKRLKKEQKKLKRMKKEMDSVIQIKPEDGYIGNEKATEYNLDNDMKNKNIAEEIKTPDKSQESALEKIYKCFACQKQFILSYYLKLHVRSHTDEKPYTCEQCGQSFITASKLGRHNKRFHLSVQYQCRICYRKFYRFEILTRHFDKKHAEDKLEGEPYDFNAILPYLKELEEQLREKQEMEKTKAPEELWSNEWPNVANQTEKVEIVVKEECKKEVEDKIEIEVVKVSMDDVEIKLEVEDVDIKEEVVADYNDSAINDTGNNGNTNNDDKKTNENDMDDASVNNDDSDEDYFPSNTWLKPEEPLEVTTNGVKCPVCDKSLSTASYMRVHMRTHTGERPFKCYICDMGFITASKMHRHVMTHPESLKDEVKLETDVKAEKEDDDREKVKKAVKKLSKKLNDKTKKLKKRPHACEFCHKRFLHLHTLQIHRKSHEGEEIKYRCHYCLLEVEDEENLKLHEASHTGPKPYQCTICDKLYKKRESMLYHRKNHKPEREFICDICTKSFNAQCKLQRHIISHSVDKYMLKYECPVCAHMFNTKYHIQMHLSTHQREGLIQEENRNEILAMVLQNARRIPRNSETHNLTDVIPSDERSRVCNICGEVFQHFYYLEEHLKSHGSKIAIENIDKEEEKKYICEVCNKGFKLHYYLKLHSFTHTKEKPFICQQCGKGFITRGKLKRHLETHTGLKKYQCHICCKFFTRPSYLRVHVRTIHGAQLVRLGLRT